jgi:hypothetical protein
LEEKGPMEANLLSSIGTSHGCTVGSSVHGVVVVGDLLRRHRLMTVRGKTQTGGETEWRVLYSVRMGLVVPGFQRDCIRNNNLHNLPVGSMIFSFLRTL